MRRLGARAPCVIRRTLVAAIPLLAACLIGCREKPTPTPAPPTPRPTSTPSLIESLEESRFALSLDGQLIGYEELHVGEADGQVVVFSEVRYVEPVSAVERRTALLSGALNPVHYELEYSRLGGYATWIAERQGEDAMHCLANHPEWYGPVLVTDVSPAPQVIVEGSPSALPFALLALRYPELTTDDGSAPDLHLLELTSDLPESRPLTVTVSARQGAVIGTTAFEGHLGDEAAAAWTYWVRPSSRALYGAEVPAFRTGFWHARLHPSWPSQGRLLIERVGQLPEGEPAAAPLITGQEAMTVAGADGHDLAGVLALPEGQGPFRCLVVHSGEGLAPRWDVGAQVTARGWAAFTYDKRGLGQSEGSYDRDRIEDLAADAVAVGRALAQDARLQPEGLVYLGAGGAGRVGALVAATDSPPYAGAALVSWAWHQPVLPSLAEAQIRGPLAAHYGWSEEQTARYLRLSLDVWQQWLFAGDDEASLLGRRVALTPLRQQADLDPMAALRAARIPVLVLHQAADDWIPLTGYQELQQALGAGQVTFQTLADPPVSAAGWSDGGLAAVLDWAAEQMVRVP